MDIAGRIRKEDDTQDLRMVNSKGKTKLTGISVGGYVFFLAWEGHQEERLVE